jgi:TonB family protein
MPTDRVYPEKCTLTPFSLAGKPNAHNHHRRPGDRMSQVEGSCTSSIRPWVTHRRGVVLRLVLLSLSLSSIVNCGVASSGALSGTDPRFSEAPISACRASSTWDLNGHPFAAPDVVRCVVARYPLNLRAIGEEGEVRVRFLIDTAGVPDTSSIRVVKLVGDRAFAKAVLVATPLIRFTPKTSGALRPIVVEMPTTFTISH